MSKINRPKIPVSFDHNVYIIEDILDINTNKRKESWHEGQYYDLWIGMTAFADEEINDSVLGFPIIFHYMFDSDGHPLHGWMHTSTVEDIAYDEDKIYIYTLNSVYIVKKYNFEEEE